jgi:hypothetical protein
MDDQRLRLSYQWDFKNGNILCFTESLLNNNTDNLVMAAVPVQGSTSGEISE